MGKVALKMRKVTLGGVQLGLGLADLAMLDADPLDDPRTNKR